MKDQIKLSIIVPAYNCYNVIEKCINSILNQTYKEFEIIIVDDGSTDGTSTICDGIKEQNERIKIIHQVNGGVSRARNVGLKNAKGKYVLFVDSDDYLDKQYVMNMVQAMEQFQVELVISGYTEISSDGNNAIRSLNQQLFEDKYQFMKKFHMLYEEYYMHVVWNKLFVKEKIKVFFDESIPVGEDLVFVLDYLKNIDKIATIEECGYNYITNQAQSLSSAFRADAFKIAEYLYLKANEYIAGTNEYMALQAIRNVFLGAVCKFVRDIASNTKLSRVEQVNLIKDISENPVFLRTSDKFDGLGKRQQIVVYLLKKKWFRLTLKIVLL